MGISASAQPMSGHPRRWAALGAVSAALSLIVVDNTVLTVALPAIAAEFGAGTAQQQAVVDAYVIVFAGLLIAAGAAADRFGRRRVMLIGLVLLAGASTAAAAAWSVWWLVAMRALMGAGAALVMPATLAVLVTVFPEAERPRAFAVWGAVASAAMAAGPVLGGALVAAWSWSGIFLMNVPVAALAAWTILRAVPESRDPQGRRVDPLGAVLSTLGMVGLVSAIIIIGEQGMTDPAVLTGCAVAVAGLGAFAWRQRRTNRSVVDFSLYRDRRFSGGSAAAAMLTVGTGSVLFVLTQYLQLVHGFSAFYTGLAVLPLAAGTMLGSAVGGKAPGRIGHRACIIAGFTITAVGFGLLALLDPASSYLLVGAGLLLAGVGTGFASPSTTSVVLSAVPADRAGMGSALNDTHQQLGIALGVALLGGVLATVYRMALPGAVPDHAASSLWQTLAHTSDTGNSSLAEAARWAFTQAQSVTLLAAACCALAGAAVAAAVLRPQR